MDPVDTSPHPDRGPIQVVCVGQTDGLGGRLRTQVSGMATLDATRVPSPAAVADAAPNPDCVVLTDDIDDPLAAVQTVRDADELPVMLATKTPDAYGTTAVLDAGLTAVLTPERIDDRETLRATLTGAARRYRDRVADQQASRVLDTMFERLPLHMFVKDDQARHTRVSDALYDADTLLGKTDYEAWPESNEPGTGSHADDLAVLETGEPILNKEEFSAAADRWRLTSKVPLYEDDDIVGLVGYALDITERKRRERLFQDTSRLLRAIVQASPVPIVVYDAAGAVQLWNDAAEDLFGWPASEAIGKTVPAFVPEEHVEEYKMLVERVRAEGSLSGVDIQRETADGEVLDLQLSAATVEPHDGTQRIVSILSDVTTLKERERRLRRQNQRIEAFSTVLAHDLRNPIQVVRGRLDTIDDPEFDTGTVDRALDRIEAIIDDVLALARESPIVTDPEPVSLADAARDAWPEDADATLVVEDTCRLRADPPRLRLLLGNLFENTLVHGTDAREAVTVTVGADADGFYVADDGSGIEESSKGRVLQPGYSTTPGGTGYGLNVVAEIAAAHDWEVTISENEAGGVTVAVTAVDRVETAEEA